MKLFWHIVKRDMSLALGRRGGVLHLLAFFIIILTFFPLAVGPETELLQEISVGIVWIAALLTSTLSLPLIFEEDFDDGSLAQLLLLPCITPIIVGAKICAHWIVSAFPLLVIAPLMGVLLGMEGKTITMLLLALLCATPTLSLIGAMSASLLLGFKKGQAILSILVLPLYIPLLIFAAGGSFPHVDIYQGLLPLITIFLIMLPLSLLISSYAAKLAISES